MASASWKVLSPGQLGLARAAGPLRCRRAAGELGDRTGTETMGELKIRVNLEGLVGTGTGRGSPQDLLEQRRPRKRSGGAPACSRV